MQRFSFLICLIFLTPLSLQGASRDVKIPCSELVAAKSTDNQTTLTQEQCDLAVEIQNNLKENQMQRVLASLNQASTEQILPSLIQNHLLIKYQLKTHQKEQAKSTYEDIEKSNTPAYYSKFLRDFWASSKGIKKETPPKAYGSKKSATLTKLKMLKQQHQQLNRARKNEVCRQLLVHKPYIPQVQEIENGPICSKDDLSSPQKLQRIKSLLKGSYPQKAAAEAEQLAQHATKLSNQKKETLNLLLIETLVRSAQSPKAIATAQKLTEEMPKNGKYWGKYAWATAKAGHLKEAISIRKMQHQKSSSRSEQEDGCFFAGFGYYETNAYQQANDYWQGCFSQFPNGTWQNALRWYIPFTHLLNQSPKSATSFWTQELTHIKKDVIKHRFFLGIAYEQIGDKTNASQHLAWVAKQAPFNYYGIRARQRLGWQPISGQQHLANALEQEYKKAIALLSAEQKIWLALGEIDLFRKSILGQQEKKNRSAFYGLYQKLGDYHRPWRGAGKIRPKNRLHQSQIKYTPTWRASYAMPHFTTVQEATRPTEIEPEMVYAIMRTESGFNERAVSPVGALGLMQLMPYTAAFVANEMQRPQPTREELLAPPASILLGTNFLNTLKKTFPHDFLVAAAYNGSPKSVTEWLKTFGDLDSLFFVERIPYKETRGYVKKVIATKALYRALNGQSLQMDFPVKTPKQQKQFPEIKTLDVQLN